MSERFDLIVIGSGSAARDAAGMASRGHGAKVAMIESERWGGSCPNVACRPTKAYLVAAELMHDVAAHAGERGIELPAPTLDLARTVAWKNSIRRDQDGWVELLREQGYDLHSGEASFVDPRTVSVGGAELAGERILIATGGRTAVPPIPGIDRIDWIDHVSALELTEVPESLLVVGAGPVGLEFAQIFARFGSGVTIVNHGAQIAERADTDAAAELQAALEDEGLEILLNGGVDSFSRDGDRVEAAVGDRTIRVSHVLLAAGRAPNVEGLGLDEVGVEVGRGGVTVDEHQRTSVEGIWAAGDVAAGPWFTPTAQYQARIAIDDMFGSGERTADYTLLPSSIFTDPELGSIGLTEAEARAAGEAAVATHPIPSLTRAQYTRTKHGICKIVYEPASRRVLGVHMVSRNAGDIVGSLVPALELGVTVDQLAGMHHVYPSYSEALKAAAEKAS